MEETQGTLDELEVKPQMPEAPASLNIRFSMNQFECLLTIRELDGNSFVAASKLVSGLPKVLEALYKKGAQPIFGKNGPPKVEAKQPETEEAEEKPEKIECPNHPGMYGYLKRNEETGATWYSHKLDDGTWCNCKEKK